MRRAPQLSNAASGLGLLMARAPVSSAAGFWLLARRLHPTTTTCRPRPRSWRGVGRRVAAVPCLCPRRTPRRGCERGCNSLRSRKLEGARRAANESEAVRAVGQGGKSERTFCNRNVRIVRWPLENFRFSCIEATRARRVGVVRYLTLIATCRAHLADLRSPALRVPSVGSTRASNGPRGSARLGSARAGRCSRVGARARCRAALPRARGRHTRLPSPARSLESGLRTGTPDEYGLIPHTTASNATLL
jgi:hypothetical protein